VYLPESTVWCDFYSGEWHPGGQEIEVKAPLERTPLFVRASGIIPMGKVMKHVGVEPDDVRQVCAFPHPTEGRGAFTLIEDDGVTLDYRQGKYAAVKLMVESKSDAIALSAQVSGDYRLPYNQIEFILPCGENRHIDSHGNSWIDAQERRHIKMEIL
jgi:alpha-glucosidase